MTKAQFIDKYGEEFKKLLTNEALVAAFHLVNAMKPITEFSNEPHLFAENRGAIRGYELYFRNFIGLSLLPKNTEEIEADYGIPNHNKQTE